MSHLVTQPHAPFRSASGAFEVHQIPAWQDNFIWLMICRETGTGAVIDGPESAPLLAYCEAQSLSFDIILNTHTHADHIGINRDLAAAGLLADKTVFGPARAAAKVPGLTDRCDEGDRVRVGAVEGRVLLTEGHINGHISYLFEDVLFCGDTLFAGGCGYLFDGPPKKMHDSLSRLSELDGGTRVCCAHEYTQDNLRFAWSVEPHNPRLAARIREVWAKRAAGHATVPSTIDEERATNPFLRSDSATIRDAVKAAMPDQNLDNALAVFTATRALKDRKDYRKLSDDQLPLA